MDMDPNPIAPPRRHPGAAAALGLSALLLLVACAAPATALRPDEAPVGQSTVTGSEPWWCHPDTCRELAKCKPACPLTVHRTEVQTCKVISGTDTYTQTDVRKPGKHTWTYQVYNACHPGGQCSSAVQGMLSADRAYDLVGADPASSGGTVHLMGASPVGTVVFRCRL